MFVIEVNPRASRTVPYVSKATGVPLAKIASRLMTGRKLRELLPEQVASGKDLETGSNYYVKSPVFPWNKFPGVDTVLGPEMKSTGEVMGVADNFGEAFAKAQLSAGQMLPVKGTVFFSVNDRDKAAGRRPGAAVCGAGLPPGRHGRHSEGAREGRHRSWSASTRSRRGGPTSSI